MNSSVRSGERVQVRAGDPQTRADVLPNLALLLTGPSGMAPCSLRSLVALD
jgi:hypothetical protein